MPARLPPSGHSADRSKEENHIGHGSELEERAHRQQETDETESTDREQVGIDRLIVDMIDAHLPPDRRASDWISHTTSPSFRSPYARHGRTPHLTSPPVGRTTKERDLRQ